MSTWRSAVLLLLLTGVVACTASPERALPAPQSSERYGAPRVERPLDVGGIYANPCRQLTGEELRALAIVRAGTSRSYLGDSECRWGSQNGDILALSVDQDRDLLVDTYRTRALPSFTPVLVGGYPAVQEMTRLEDNNCIVTVGLGPKQALRSDWTGLGTYEPGDPDPCERAETAAALVIRKLPPQR